MVTKDQFKVIVKAMKAVYTKPEFIPDKDAFDVWYVMLRDLDYELLANATQKHMMTSPYPPTIADIRSAAAEFTAVDGDPVAMSEMDAWDMVRRAISNSTYNAEAEFAALPPILQKTVGSPGNLREWAAMDTETVNSVQQSHFLRAYRTMTAREAERLKLSPAVRQLLDAAQRGESLPEAIPGGDMPGGRMLEYGA